MIQQILATTAFAGAAAVSGGVIWQSVAPQWRRVLRLAAGQPDAAFMPLAQLAQTERRFAVRRWSAESRPAALGWRAAA